MSDDHLRVIERVPLALDAEVVSALLKAHGAKDPSLALFQLMSTSLAEAPGHILLTALRYYHHREESQRIYSSRPQEYPVGGRKTLGQAPRMRQVLDSAQPYIGRGRQEIIDNYADHSTLLAMGCESIVNMPVCWGSEVLGTVNLLHVQDRYGEADLPRIAAWAQLSLPAFLAATPDR